MTSLLSHSRNPSNSSSVMASTSTTTPITPQFVPGIIRNRTAIFLNYRKQTRRAQQGGGRSGVIELSDVSTTSTDGGGTQKAKLLSGGATTAGQDSIAVPVPPAWMPATEDLSSMLELVRKKINDLQRAHANQFLVQVDDTSHDEQQAIEITTAELSRLLGDAQRRVKQLGATASSVASQSPEEAKMLKNVQSAYASQLGELTKNFRQAQQAYLTRVRKRNEKFRDSFNPTSGNDEDEDSNSIDDYEDKGFTDEQMGALKKSELNVEQRDKQIRRIHKSIIELSDIVKDLSFLVADQGTILDRIDYNIEHTAEDTGEAVQQLRQASDYQKSARTKMFILILIILVIIGAVVLVLRILGLF